MLGEGDGAMAMCWPKYVLNYFMLVVALFWWKMYILDCMEMYILEYC
jgi:hypothetical protein